MRRCQMGSVGRLRPNAAMHAGPAVRPQTAPRPETARGGAPGWSRTHVSGVRRASRGPNRARPASHVERAPLWCIGRARTLWHAGLGGNVPSCFRQCAQSSQVREHTQHTAVDRNLSERRLILSAPLDRAYEN